MVELAGLEIADPPEAWAGLGFTVEDGACTVGRVSHLLVGGPGKGIVSWSLDPVAPGDGAGKPSGVDGLSTVPPAEVRRARPGAPAHPNGTVVLDHLVVSSPDLERTVGALGGAGLRERRRRRSGTYGREMVQVFFRMGEVVLEVVGGPEPSGDGPARFFGLAFTVADLDATAAYLGRRLHPAKDAVQPRRRIATLDRSAGSTVAMAFMSPGPLEYV